MVFDLAVCRPLHSIGSSASSSTLGLAGAALLILVMAMRAVLEERALHAELDGYADYAARVRYRLVPHLW